jgi:hypothetical protein
MFPTVCDERLEKSVLGSLLPPFFVVIWKRICKMKKLEKRTFIKDRWFFLFAKLE